MPEVLGSLIASANEQQSLSLSLVQRYAQRHWTASPRLRLTRTCAQPLLQGWAAKRSAASCARAASFPLPRPRGLVGTGSTSASSDAPSGAYQTATTRRPFSPDVEKRNVRFSLKRLADRRGSGGQRRPSQSETRRREHGLDAGLVAIPRYWGT